MLEKIKLSDLRLGKKLGNGAFGEVFESTIAGSDVIYATKKLEKSKYMRNPRAYRYLENEIKILKSINHENIIKLYNSDLEDRKFRYLITEYCNGGDLENILDYYMAEKIRPFSEEEVQYIMRQLVSGIKYLHSKSANKLEIIHRDLKLENILLHFDNEDDRINKRILKAKIKIINFGFARCLKGLAGNIVGTTPMFWDPKILFIFNKIDFTNDFGYGKKVDIYSLGIICSYLLTGHPPFDVHTMGDLVSETKKGKFKISMDFSKETISFLNYMLRYDPKKRLNINQLSKHKFIANNVKDFTRKDRNKLEKNNLEKEEPDEFQKEIIKKLNEAEALVKKEKKDDDVVIINEPILDTEKLILESFSIINDNAMVIEPKLIPFIPGKSEKILL
jgi:serine/threonine protein kinase